MRLVKVIAPIKINNHWVYRIDDTIEVDMDRMLTDYNEWQDIVIQSGSVPIMKFSSWIITKLEDREKK